MVCVWYGVYTVYTYDTCVNSRRRILKHNTRRECFFGNMLNFFFSTNTIISYRLLTILCLHAPHMCMCKHSEQVYFVFKTIHNSFTQIMCVFHLIRFLFRQNTIRVHTIGRIATIGR